MQKLNLPLILASEGIASTFYPDGDIFGEILKALSVWMFSVAVDVLHNFQQWFVTKGLKEQT